jgi:phenylacetate-CoA ligase
VTAHRWIVPRVVFPVAERFAGRRMWTELRRLREVQWLPRAELEARQMEQLGRLLRHAAVNVPHYRDVLGGAGVRLPDIRARADLARIPVTTKADLRAGFPERTSAANLPTRRRVPMRTSGSTGLPFEFYWDRAATDLLFAAHLFSLEWAGAALWDTRLVIATPSTFATNTPPVSRPIALARRVVFGEQGIRLSADALTGPALRAVVAGLPRGRGYFIRGYPSAIARLGRQLAREGASVPRPPRVVIAYGESLTPIDGRAIREAFGCPVVNYYTSFDVPRMAQTCPDDPEVLHVGSDRVIVRVVRADGSDAPVGEPGHVVVTDLTNEVMPLINYEIGDHAVAGPPCRCGRGFPTLASVEGRSTEEIRTLDDRRITGVFLGHFLTFEAGVIPHILEYQAVQVAPDRVILRVVPGRGLTPAFADGLASRLRSLLGPGMAAEIETVDHIPVEPSGKRLIIKRALPPAPQRA